MYKDFIGWSLENIGKGTVETKYTVEYINDKKTWDKFVRTEDLDLLSKREYDNIEDALTFYLTWYVNENCFDIKLWEQIYVNNEIVLEQMIQPRGSMKYYLRQSVNKEMENRMRNMERKTNGYMTENKLYKGFIKAMGKQFEDLFDEYLKREAMGNE